MKFFRAEKRRYRNKEDNKKRVSSRQPFCNYIRCITRQLVLVCNEDVFLISLTVLLFIRMGLIINMRITNAGCRCVPQESLTLIIRLILLSILSISDETPTSANTYILPISSELNDKRDETLTPCGLRVEQLISSVVF